MAAKPDLVHSYCDAVEGSIDAHPIQRAQDLLPAGVFSTAADLYDYTVCVYDIAGTPLDPAAAAGDARWLIFDNVYARERGGRFPKNHLLRKARNAGFRPEGQPKVKYYGPERAANVWRGAVSQWGDPRGFGGADSPRQVPSGSLSRAAPALPHAAPSASKPLATIVHGNPLATSLPARSSEPIATSSTVQAPNWAQETVNATASLWRELRGQYPFWESGFAVFYSPVQDNAKVVIVGANPGGDSTSMNLEIASRIPSAHDYFAYNYPMALKMRDLFSRAGRLDLLRNSVKLNLNFFRSSDATQWRMAPQSARSRMEAHSAKAAIAAIERIRPALLLCEGTATFDKVLSQLQGVARPTVVVQSPGGRAYVRARTPWAGKVVGIIHPTGARYSNETWTKVAAALAEDVAAL